METSDVRPGDQVTFLDFEGIERFGTVTAFVPDASGVGAGFAGFVCLDPISGSHLWGYLSQIMEINGVVAIA
jgi:hypothetical protein